MRLTDAKVRNAKPRDKRYQIADGNGLYLEVRPNGTKSWLARLEKNGKRTWKMIGNVPIYTLDEARARMIEIKRGEVGLEEEEKPRITFRSVAEELIPKLEKTDISEKNANEIYARLEKYAYPHIGDKDMSQITTKDMYAIVERLEALGFYPTAQKTIQICSRIFRYGMLKEYCASDPCYALKGTLRQRPTVHRAALTDPVRIGRLLREIREYHSVIVRCAVQFSAYTFCRPGEVRLAEWEEIDRDRGAWIIPAEKMKMKRDHMVPLTPQMLNILEQMMPISGQGKYIFPSSRYTWKSAPMAQSSVNIAIRALGYTSEEMTAHGFRSMASTILNENGFNYDWIELQLAHAPKDGVRAAYNRAKYWDDRVKMVQWYNDYLDELRDGCKNNIE